VVEEKTCCCVGCIIESGHDFDPFGKVIYCYDNVLVSIIECRMESQELYAPFLEGVGGDDWV
jgi:hypothetical protein